MHLDDLRGAPRRFVGPELVDQAIGRDDLIRMEQHQSEHGALLAAADVEHALAFEHLERPQDPKVHHALRAACDSKLARKPGDEVVALYPCAAAPQRLRNRLGTPFDSSRTEASWTRSTECWVANTRRIWSTKRRSGSVRRSSKRRQTRGALQPPLRMSFGGGRVCTSFTHELWLEWACASGRVNGGTMNFSLTAVRPW